MPRPGGPGTTTAWCGSWSAPKAERALHDSVRSALPGGRDLRPTVTGPGYALLPRQRWRGVGEACFASLDGEQKGTCSETGADAQRLRPVLHGLRQDRRLVEEVGPGLLRATLGLAQVVGLQSPTRARLKTPSRAEATPMGGEAKGPRGVQVRHVGGIVGLGPICRQRKRTAAVDSDIGRAPIDRDVARRLPPLKCRRASPRIGEQAREVAGNPAQGPHLGQSLCDHPRRHSEH